MKLSCASLATALTLLAVGPAFAQQAPGVVRIQKSGTVVSMQIPTKSSPIAQTGMIDELQELQEEAAMRMSGPPIPYQKVSAVTYTPADGMSAASSVSTDSNGNVVTWGDCPECRRGLGRHGNGRLAGHLHNHLYGNGVTNGQGYGLGDYLCCKFGFLIPTGNGGPGVPPFGCYSRVYPQDPSYFDGRDGQLWAAQGYGTPVAVPLAPVVGHTYNYGWGVPSSRLTPVSRIGN